MAVDIKEVLEQRNTFDKTIALMNVALKLSPERPCNSVTLDIAKYAESVGNPIAAKEIKYSRDWNVDQFAAQFLNEKWYEFIEFIEQSKEKKIAALKDDIDKNYRDIFGQEPTQ